MQIELEKLTKEFVTLCYTQLHTPMLVAIKLNELLFAAAYTSLTEEQQLAYKDYNDFVAQMLTECEAYTNSQMTPQQLEEADALARKLGLN